MGYPLQIATRHLGTTSKGAFVTVCTVIAIIGVTLGVAVLLAAMSITGGFQSEFRQKVLGVNAHVLVLKYSTDFREYRDIMEIMENVPGITGVAPFTINPMMVSHKEKTATGILVKGVDPSLMPNVLDLPKHIREGGTLDGLRKPGATPPERKAFAGIQTRPSVTKSKPRTAGKPDDEATHDSEGRNLPLLRAIEDSIADGEKTAGQADKHADKNADNHAAKHADMQAEKNANKQADDQADEGADIGGIEEIIAIQQGTDEPEEKPSEKNNQADAVTGSVVPEGGYKSKLPDPDEDLPEEVVPDPCNSPEAKAGLPGIAIGGTLAKNLSADVGDCLQVTSPTIGFSYSSGVIRPPVAKQFKVIAIFDAGFDQYDSKLVYVDLYEAQRFQDFGDSVTGVEAKVSDIDQANAIEKEVASRISPTLYTTMDWEDLNRGLFTALRIQKIGMSTVLAIIIFLASFPVVATLIMLVLEKKKEIAVLKAMGATDVAILRVFVYQGGLIGVVGTALGLGLGFAWCEGLRVFGFPLDPKVYFISTLPVEVRPIEFVLTGAIALTLCLIATVIPSLYAARLRPADGVRPG